VSTNPVQSELPIACSLNAADLAGRLAEIAALGRDALIDSHVSGSAAVLRFAAGDRVRARVTAIADAEARCCAFLTLRVSDEPDLVILRIDGPEDSEPIVRELADAFSTAPEIAT
jgi:hypothetical protein